MNPINRSAQYQGCLIGLALGDALCAPYEGGPVERLVWRLIGKHKGRKRYTDDTQMTLDLCHSLLENQGVNQNHLAQTFAASYRWSRGYGPGAAWLLKQIHAGKDWQSYNQKRFPGGSYGNGAAMRAAAVGLYFQGDEKKIIAETIRQGEITHAHPLALEGAQYIALISSWAIDLKDTEAVCDVLSKFCKNDLYALKLSLMQQWLNMGKRPNPKEVAANLGNGIAALDSCVTAIYIALTHKDKPLRALIDFAIQCGGDTDTIGAMAGAIWGAYNGIEAIPKEDIQRLENSEGIIAIAKELCEGFSPAQPT